MIKYLAGKVIDKSERSLTLNVNGVGYGIRTSNTIISEAGENQELELFIYTHIREDTLDLYGFKSKKDRELFEMLISVSGIGPKVGMDILEHPTTSVVQAITSQDIPYLKSIPGLGKKTAERLILELKTKLSNIDLGGPTVTIPKVTEDVVIALEGLGYNRNQIYRRLKDLPAKVESEEEIIKYFLKKT